MTISERMFWILAQKPNKNAAGLGRAIGVGTNQTTTWKQRNTDPPAKYLVRICEYLEVSLSYLVTGEQTTDDVLSSVNDDEARILEKYRLLDADGKDAVRGVLLSEQRRIESKQGMGTSIVG